MAPLRNAPRVRRALPFDGGVRMTTNELETMTSGFQTASVILAANRAGIFAALCRRPSSADALASGLGLAPRAVAVLTDALVATGVLERREGALSVPDQLRPALDPGSPTSMTNALDHRWFVLQRWAQLDRVLVTGRPVRRRPDDDQRLQAFILGMADLARRGAPALWDAVDLTGRTHLVDVGGGPGELALAALERFPGLSATVFDLPAVLPIGRRYARRRGLGRRIAFRAGDALENDIPPCDVALVSSLLHSYGPRGAARIAAHVAAGVKPGGLVLVREFMWDDEAHSGPVSTALFAVNMLSGTPEGRCWSPGELTAIFGAAGFGGWELRALDPRTSLLVGAREDR